MFLSKFQTGIHVCYMGVTPVLWGEEKLSSHHSRSSNFGQFHLQRTPIVGCPMISVGNSRSTVFDNLFQSFPGLKPVSWRILDSVFVTPYESLCAGSNWSDTLLIQYRRPVGGGPSRNTWPRWESHWKTKICHSRSVVSSNILQFMWWATKLKFLWLFIPLHF